MDHLTIHKRQVEILLMIDALKSEYAENMKRLHQPIGTIIEMISDEMSERHAAEIKPAEQPSKKIKLIVPNKKTAKSDSGKDFVKRSDVLNVIGESKDGVTPKEISNILRKRGYNVTPSAITNHLLRCQKSNEVFKAAYGKYALTDKKKVPEHA